MTNTAITGSLSMGLHQPSLTCGPDGSTPPGHPAPTPDVLHNRRRTCVSSQGNGPAAGISSILASSGGSTSTLLPAAGPTYTGFTRHCPQAKKQRNTRVGFCTLPWCCCLIPFVIGIFLAATIITNACPNPSHQTPTGEKVVAEDYIVAVVLEPTVIADDMVLATPEQYMLRDFITDQTKAKYKSLSWEECEFFANQCCRFDDPLKWCARGWAESSARRDVVNDSGHYGFWQISSLHIPRMTALGLSIVSEVDRTTFAKVLSASRGNRPWTQSEPNRKKFQKQLEKELKETNDGNQP